MGPTLPDTSPLADTNMQGLRDLLAQLLGAKPARQTSIGLKVPHSHPKDKIEVLANLAYVQQEIGLCEASIKHAENRSQSHRVESEWVLRYVRIALLVARDADMERAVELSNTALAILPKINPYAERFYECLDLSDEAFKNRELLRELATEYKRGAIALGLVILETDRDAPSFVHDRTMKEDYKDLNSTLVPV